MKSFKAFIAENKFHSDIPNQNWLKSKQETAEKKYSKIKVSGPITGHFDEPHILNPQKLRSIPGLNGEHQWREDPNSSKALKLNHPSEFDTSKKPILIGVNHKGEHFVMEGNHRLGYAIRNKLPHIHAMIQYHNGGEEVDGPLHPSKIEKFK